jgi:hypothetical protein
MISMRLSVALAGALLLAGCATQKTAVNKSLTQQSERPLPHRVLLAPPEILVNEIAAGEVVEEVHEWSEKASAEAAKSVEAFAQSTRLFEVVQPSKLSDAEHATLEQYNALYALVSGSAYAAQHSQFDAWQKRAADFDYTLGPGMDGLAKSANLDAIVFVVGTDYISTASRKAAMAVGLAMGLFTGVYMGPQSRPSFLSAGVVDMHTGELLWYSTELRAGAEDLRDPKVVKGLVDDLFKTYPGAAKTANVGK